MALEHSSSEYENTPEENTHDLYQKVYAETHSSQENAEKTPSIKEEIIALIQDPSINITKDHNQKILSLLTQNDTEETLNDIQDIINTIPYNNIDTRDLKLNRPAIYAFVSTLLLPQHVPTALRLDITAKANLCIIASRFKFDRRTIVFLMKAVEKAGNKELLEKIYSYNLVTTMREGSTHLTIDHPETAANVFVSFVDTIINKKASSTVMKEVFTFDGTLLLFNELKPFVFRNLDEVVATAKNDPESKKKVSLCLATTLSTLTDKEERKRCLKMFEKLNKKT